MTETPNTPRPTEADLLARLAALGYAGHADTLDHGHGIEGVAAYSWAARRGTYGHPRCTVSWVAHRDADGQVLDTGWLQVAGS